MRSTYYIVTWFLVEVTLFFSHGFFCHFRCAELLVMKAELELMQGEREESGIDLDKVRNLLELCTGLFNTDFQ